MYEGNKKNYKLHSSVKTEGYWLGVGVGWKGKRRRWFAMQHQKLLFLNSQRNIWEKKTLLRCQTV